MKYILFIYLKKYWLIAFRGTEKQCRKQLAKMGSVHYMIARAGKDFCNLPTISTELDENPSGLSNNSLKFMNHTINFNDKLNHRVWIDIRMASSYFQEGHLYNQLLDNKFLKIGKLVSITEKYLTVISNSEAYADMGLDRDSVIRAVQSFYPRVNLIDSFNDGGEYRRRKASRVMVLIFEEYQVKQTIKQGELLL